MATITDNSMFAIPKSPYQHETSVPDADQSYFDQKFQEITDGAISQNPLEANQHQGVLTVQDIDRARQNVSFAYDTVDQLRREELRDYRAHEKRINLDEELIQTSWIEAAKRDTDIVARSAETVNTFNETSHEGFDLPNIFSAGVWIKNMRAEAINVSRNNPADPYVQAIVSKQSDYDLAA